MADIAQKVPRELVVATFGGVGAIRPETYEDALRQMATKFRVPLDELRPFVTEILKGLPCPLD